MTDALMYLAGVVLFAGYGLRRLIPFLGRVNIPAPVIGGFVVAIAMTIAYSRGVQLFKFDTTLQTPLQNAFFTSIGFAASVQLMKQGGPLVLRFFLFATLIAVLQNVVGAAVAAALGQPERTGGRPGRRMRVRMNERRPSGKLHREAAAFGSVDPAARASAARFTMPPESSAGYFSPASAGRPTSRSFSSASPSITGVDSFRCSIIGSWMFSRTVSALYSAPSWNVTP